MNIINYTGICVLICTGEADSYWQSDSSVTCYFNLDTLNIQLNAAIGVLDVANVGLV